jgi:hypothetical protein
MRIQTASQDTTISDPLAFWYLRRFFKVNAMEMVTLTVTTDATDDNVFLMSRDGRFRFHNNGDGTYTGTWRPVVRGHPPRRCERARTARCSTIPRA